MAQANLSGQACSSSCCLLNSQPLLQQRGCLENSFFPDASKVRAPFLRGLWGPRAKDCQVFDESRVALVSVRAYSSSTASQATTEGGVGISILSNGDRGSAASPLAVESSPKDLVTDEVESESLERSGVDYEAALNDVLARLSDDSGVPFSPDWQAGVWLAPKTRVKAWSRNGAEGTRRWRRPGVADQEKVPDSAQQEMLSENRESGSNSDDGEEPGEGRVGQTVSSEVGTSGSEDERANSEAEGRVDKTRDVWIRPGSTIAHSRLPEQIAAAKAISRKSRVEPENGSLGSPDGEAQDGVTSVVFDRTLDVGRSSADRGPPIRMGGEARLRAERSAAKSAARNGGAHLLQGSGTARLESQTAKSDGGATVGAKLTAGEELVKVERAGSPKLSEEEQLGAATTSKVSEEEESLQLGIEALQATNEWLRTSAKASDGAMERSVNQRIKRTPRMFNVQGKEQQGGIRVRPRIPPTRKSESRVDTSSRSDSEAGGWEGRRKLERGESSPLEAAKEVVVKVASAAAIAAGQVSIFPVCS